MRAKLLTWEREGFHFMLPSFNPQMPKRGAVSGRSVHDLQLIIGQGPLEGSSLFSTCEPRFLLLWVQQNDGHGFFMDGAHNVIGLSCEE